MNDLSQIAGALLLEYQAYILKTHFEPFESCEPTKYMEFDCCPYHRKSQETFSKLSSRCRLLDWMSDVNIRQQYGHEPFSVEWWKTLARIAEVPFPAVLYKQFFIWDGLLYVSILKQDGFVGLLIFAGASAIDVSYIERCLNAVLNPVEMVIIRQYFDWLREEYPDIDSLMALVMDDLIQKNIAEKIKKLDFRSK